MRRTLLAIGCDEYDDDYYKPLLGAENDAVSIYNILTSESFGGFDPDSSILLRSPTYAQVNEALSKTIFSEEELTSLSVFYAGHGQVKDGRYFMICQDSAPDRLTVSALHIGELFALISEARITHTNLVVDACQSGGVVHDLQSLLKPEVIGLRGSPSVSMLLASCSDEYALEMDGRGVCTEAVIKCVNGELANESNRSTLDLIDIGKVVASNVQERIAQQPQFWGLSLFGHDPFCLNPKRPVEQSLGSSPLFALDISASDFEAISKHSSELWLEHYELETMHVQSRLYKRLAAVVNSLDHNEKLAAHVTQGLVENLSKRYEVKNDEFGVAEIFASGAAALLHLAGDSGVVDSAILALIRKSCIHVCEGISQVLQDLQKNEYALLSRYTGLPDLFYLPIRISKILGWASFARTASRDLDVKFPDEEFVSLLKFVIETYSTSVVSVSDVQAAYLLCLLHQKDELDDTEDVETILSLMFNSFLGRGAAVAHSDMEAERTLEYLQLVKDQKRQDVELTFAQPSQLLSVFMLGYPLLNMHFELDTCLKTLDHKHFNFFLPKSYTEFSADRIEEGVNNTFTIGDGIWRVNEMISKWNDLRTELECHDELDNDAIKYGATVASLLAPNRCAWFHVPELKTY